MSSDEDFPVTTINSEESIDAIFENDPIDPIIYIPGFNVPGEDLNLRKLRSGQFRLQALLAQILPAHQDLWNRNTNTTGSVAQSDREYRADEYAMKDMLYRFVRAGTGFDMGTGVKRKTKNRKTKNRKTKNRKTKNRKTKNRKTKNRKSRNRISKNKRSKIF
jgi:hypothetical protein